MATLNMGRKAYPFTSDEVDRQITNHKAGNYALGRLDEYGDFHVKYVGRSDPDVNDRIKDHLNKGYSRFKYRLHSALNYQTPDAVYEKGLRKKTKDNSKKAQTATCNPSIEDV